MGEFIINYLVSLRWPCEQCHLSKLESALMYRDTVAALGPF